MLRRTPLKRSGFRRLTYEEIMEKQAQARAKAEEKATERAKTYRPATKPRKTDDPIKTLKTSLWKAFSRYIRKKYADINGMVMTCDGVRAHWKDTHCGHLIVNTERNSSLGGNALWYDERNFAPQSSNGNYYNANDSAKKYMLWATKLYGSYAIDEMFRLKQMPRKFTEEELRAKLEHYKTAFNNLP